jgi:hypothetical protein
MSKFSNSAQNKNAIRQGARSKRLLWLLFEIGIGVLVVAGLLFWAEKNPSGEFPAKWLGLGISTLVIFGYLIYWERMHLANWRFWVYWLGFLCLHLIVIGLIVATVYRVPLVLFVLTTIMEASLIIPVFVKIEMDGGKKDRSAGI